VKRTELKTRYRNTGPSRDVVEAVLERAGYQCELCGAAVGMRRGVDHHIHHRRPRRMGGSGLPDTNMPQNLLLLDPSCHDVVERERTAAHEGGWLVHQDADPLTVEVLRHGREWVLLRADATVEIVRAVEVPDAEVR
jgi:hypothetical protein